MKLRTAFKSCPKKTARKSVVKVTCVKLFCLLHTAQRLFLWEMLGKNSSGEEILRGNSRKTHLEREQVLQGQSEWGKVCLQEKDKSWVPLAPLGIPQILPALPIPSHSSAIPKHTSFHSAWSSSRMPWNSFQTKMCISWGRFDKTSALDIGDFRWQQEDRNVQR